MRKKHMIKLNMNYTEEEMIRKPPKMTETEKTARLYSLAKKLGVKIGGAK